MLIHIADKYTERQMTGKGRFSARLVRAWHSMGIQTTVDANANADVSYQVGKIYCPSKAKKHVLRVGPACIDTNMDWKHKNREKAQAVKKADAVVYQSEYSRQIYHALVCKPDVPEAVILKGADPRDYEVEAYNSTFKYNFLASTRVWLKQKRLKELIKSFLLADIDDSCLLVCGDNCGVADKYDEAHNIMFFGPTNDAVLARLYRLVAKTGAYLHGVWVDCAPNSMVEAQVAGCPVICTDQGGTPEILRYGALIKDKQFKMKPVDLDHPPAIDREAMAEAMRYFALKQGLDKISAKFIQPDDLYIENIARKYYEFFESIV